MDDKEKATSRQRGLKSLKDRTPEEKKEIASMGGVACQKKKKERKLVSQIYADFLAQKHKIDKNEITGSDLLAEVVRNVLFRSDSASVSMLKEIRESTEGSKVNLEGQIIVYLDNQDKGL
jgi:hypothetical protein